MTDMIEQVARAMALAANDYEGPDLQWQGWTDLAQAAITAHTAALIAGAGQIAAELVGFTAQRLLGGEQCFASVSSLNKAAATIAAMRAELARVKEALKTAADNLYACDKLYGTPFADVAGDQAIRALDPAAIARTTAMDELIAGDAHLIDTLADSDGDDGA